jgi:hypothetical protein
LHNRKGHFAVSRATAIVAVDDVSSAIRRLVEAREKARTMIEQLKRNAAGADLEWVQGLANEIAATGSIESVMGKYNELKRWSSGAEERIAACLVVAEGMEKLLAQHKKYHREVVIYHLRATASRLAQLREAHKKDREHLAARLETLLLEIRELEPDALSSARAGKS